MFDDKRAEKIAQFELKEVTHEDQTSTMAITQQTETNQVIAKESQNVSATAIPDSKPLPGSQSKLEAAVDIALNPPVDESKTPPQLGDRYEVLEFIGSGGMGTVWKVYDKVLMETFAVKVLKPGLLTDAIAVKRFEKEASLASDLTHSNIAPIFGPGTDSRGHPFIILGYVDGDSLADILAIQGKLSEERALDIFTQLCEALSHAHMKGIIHRDIKPTNIIISKTESGGDMVHLVDFGIARCIHEELTKTQALTKSVDILGSPRYMSPEQFLGGQITNQSDIYSLGCVLYEMLTGFPPFTDENSVKLILQHLSETPDLTKVPLNLQMLVGRCLSKNIEIRYPSVDNLLQRLTLDSSRMIGVPTGIHTPHIAVTAFVIIIIAYVLYIPPAVLNPITLFPAVCSMAWLYVSDVNTKNPGRSVDYRVLEFNLFLVSIAATLLIFLSFTHVKNIELIAGTILAIVFPLLVIQPRAIELYTKLISALLRRQPRPFRSLLEQQITDRFGLTFARWMVRIGSAWAAISFFLPATALICGVTIDHTNILPFFGCLAQTIAVMLLRVCVDFITGKRKELASLWFSTKVQAALTAFVLIIAFGVTSTIGKAGFNQLVQQVYQGESQGQMQERLEALNYPDSLLAIKAKLMAAYSLWESHECESEALALCQQVIENKRVNEPAILASAYALRYKINSSLRPGATDSSDLEKGLSILEGAKGAAFPSGLESAFLSYLRPEQFERAAVTIGDLAAKNGDLGIAKRSLKLAEKCRSTFMSHVVYDWLVLRQKIEALSAQSTKNGANGK